MTKAGLVTITLMRRGVYDVHIAAPWHGAVIVSLLPEVFRGLKDYQDLFYGAGLILLLIYAPKGLAGLGKLMSRGGRT